MKKSFTLIYGLLLVCLLMPSASAQDIQGELNKLKNLKSFSPKKLWEAGIKASGSVSSNTTFYDAKSIENRRLPFESFLSGNINFDLFGKIKMPFTFSINSQQINWAAFRFAHPFDRKFRFQQPFNRFQFKPTYKGVTLLLGVNSMTFSPLTLSGHRFKGLGIQFKPKKFPVYGNFMTGVLQQSVRIDTTGQTSNNRPAYKRYGTGIQLGYKNKQNAIEIITFRAIDKLNSLPYSLDSIRIFPQNNAVVSLKGQTTIAKKIEIKAEYAVSGITENTKATTEGIRESQWQRMGGLLPVNASTIYRKAIKTDIAYKAQTFSVGGSYNRIDPDYRTLGAYFFTNDLENITANIATQLMQGKVSVMANIGRQRDNLKIQKSQSLSQWVGSTSLQIVPSEFTNLNLMYSNFTSFTNMRTELDYLTSIVPYNALDTLNYRQISQNMQASLVHTFGKPDSSSKKRTMLMSDLLYQQSDDQQGKLKQGSRIANLTLTLNHADETKNQNFGAGANIARNDYLISNDWLIGPTANYSRAFFDKKLTTQANLTFLQTFGDNKETSKIFNANFSAGGTIKEKHQLNFMLLFMNRQVKEIKPISKDFWQVTAMLNYVYSFNLIDTSKKKK
jgi:hypothetical protein